MHEGLGNAGFETNLETTSDSAPHDANQTGAIVLAQAAPAAEAPAQQPPRPAPQLPAAPPAAETHFDAAASKVVRLPQGTSLDDIEVSGKAIILKQADGRAIVIDNGVSNVPTLMVGDIEVPAGTLTAVFDRLGIVPGAGPAGAQASNVASSGGNFALPNGNVGSFFGLTDLLPPTELQFPTLEQRELAAVRRFSVGPSALSSTAGVVLAEAALSAGRESARTDEIGRATLSFDSGPLPLSGVRFASDLGSLQTETNGLPGADIAWVRLSDTTIVGRVGGIDAILLQIEPLAGPGGGATDVTVTVTLIGPVPHAPGGGLQLVDLGSVGVIVETGAGTAQGSVQIAVSDDGPAVAVVADAAVSALLDESATTSSAPTLGVANPGNDPDVAGAGRIAVATSTGSLVMLTAEAYGADGAAATGAKHYALTVTNAASGLTLTDGSAIALVLEGTVVVGRVVGGAFAGQAAFALEIDASTGVATVEQYLSLHHPDGSDANDVVSLAAGTVGVVVTLTDGDGDTATSAAVDVSGQIRFQDDAPQLTITAGPTLGALSVVEASGAGGEQTLAIGAPAFTATAVDGTSSAVSYALALAGGGATALVTTQGNHAITLVADSGTVIAGRYDSDGDGSLDATAFTLTLNGTQVTLTSLEALEHANGPQNGEDDTLDLNGLVNLVATVTVTDGDNDQVVASQATAAPLSLSFADTDPQLTITAGPTLGALSVVEASGAGGEQTLAIGAPAFTATAVDGTSSAVSYALALAGGGATALVTTQGNHAITLVADSGTVIAGRYDSDGNGSLDATAFTLTLNGTQVTLTSLEALEHANGPQNGEDDTLDLNGLVNLVATVTVTDGDNDQVVASQATAAPLSLSFADTDPQLTITAGPTLGALSVVEASGAGGEQTLAIGAPAFTATAVDGTSSAVSYALALAGGGATALVTTQGNHAITLVADSGTVIAGRYDSDGNGSLDATAFTLTLNGTQVTLTSLEALEHANGPQNGEDDTLDLNGLVNLVATVTVTDGDNDQVVASQATAAPLSLSFADTDPQLTITAGPTLGALSVVEASGAGGEQTLAIGAPAFTATAVDGTSSAVSYALALAGGGTTALVTTQGNHAITLVADSGSVIAGRYDSDGDGSLDATAFTLTLNGTQVTLTSLEALEHANGPQNGEDDTLDLNGLVNLVATVTVTDGDNDQVVASQATAAPLSLSFADTDPQLTITAGPTLGALSVVEASGAGGEQTLVIGAPAFTATAVDGTSSAVSYALALAGGGATALVTTQGNHAITLVADSGTVIAGRYDSDGNGSLDATAFTLTLNGTQVTLTSLEALEHANGPQNGEDDTLDLNGLVNLVATVTVTDGDNDQVVASQATAAPLSLSFADTDPQLTITAGPTLGALSVVEASGAGGEQTLAIGAPAFTAAAVDGTSSAVSYALALAGGGATALVTTQGNHAITLVADSGTAIAGRYDSDGDGSLDATAFTLTLNGTQVTLTSLEALEHANGPQNGEDDTLDLNGLVNLVATVTVTDGDNDQVVASQATAAPLSLSFADTDPQLTITAGPTLGALSVVEASGAGGEQTLAIGAPAFTATAVDGTSTAVSYALALAGGGTTALVTTQGNHAITLVADSGTVIAGRYDSDGDGSLDATAFTLTLNGTQVTLTSLEALEHANGPQNGEDDTLDLNGLVNLVATVTVTDGDNDQVVASQATAAPLSLSFADTDPQLTITAGPTLGALSVVEASGAGGEQTLAIGAPAFTATAVDGTSSAVSYALALAGGGATALVTTQGNHAITLVADSGTVIAGRYDSDGNGSLDATAFTLTLNGTQVTLTSLEALEHANGPQNGEDDTLDLNGLVNLVATVTVTDGDNDQVVASQATAAPLSLSFADTDPQLTITAGPTLGALSVVEASGAGGEQTLAIGAPAFTATAVDGTSSAVSYALALAGGGATALVTTQGNHAITLVADSGSAIAGRYDSDGNGSLDATAFTLTLNGTQVTLTSLEALEHANGPQNGEDDTLDLNGLVNLVATVTVTDGDNDQVVASQATAAPLSLSFADTDPQLTITAGPTLGALSVVEASGAGGEQTLAIGAPAFTATAVDGTSSAVSYALALAGGGTTALVTTQGNHAITLVADSGSVIAGRYDSDGDGSLDATAFTLTLNGTQVTLTSLEALEHANGPQNGEDDTLDLNGLVNLVATVTVTDGDNDQVVASQATAAPLSLSFADTDPQLTITAGPTLGALSVVEASGAGGEQTLVIGAPAFTATAVDGTSSAVSYALALAGGGATALVTTQGNHAITLVADSGTAIAGRYDSDGDGSLDATAFTLTLNGTQVTLTSLEALEHANGPQNGEDDTLDLNGLVNLVATVTVTDGDNDQVVASQATAAPLSLSFADTDPQLTITAGPTLGALSVVEASGAGGEQTLAIGAPAFTAAAVDGTSSAVSYALALAGGGATALVTTQGNHAITLVADSGSAIAGRYDSDGDGSLDATAFTLMLNGTQVTLTSLEALEHANGPQNGEDDTLDLNGLVNLVATVTVTDGDNDQVVASQATAAPLSLSFADTDPQLTITSGPTLGALSVVEASGAGGEQTLAIGAPAFTATAVDGTSSAVSYALALAGGGATALVTTQGNHAITLVADSGTAIAGRYDSDGDGSLDATAFTLTLNGTQVTLTSLEALEHANGPQNGEDDTLDLNGLVNLVATVTVTDGDNDQVVASQATAAPLSLSFADTDPQLTITAGPTLGALSVVEASGAGGEQTLAIGAPAFTATAVDGTSSAVSYALALAGGGATALVTTQGNHAITLVADSGTAIAGRYDSDGDGSLDATAFTLTLNGTQVTLTSLEALEHANGPQNGEDDTLDLNGLVNLVATVTVTDGDNDQVVASQATAAPLSLSFADTDPQLTITAGPTLGALSVVEASGAGGEQTLVIGAPAFTATAVDGTSSAVSYALALAGGGATALVTTQGNHAITLVADSGTAIAGRYDSDGDGSLDATAFTLTLNGTQVTLTSLEALEHANGPQNGEDDTLDLNGLVNLVATVTVTDGDNDQVVASQATAAPLSLSFADTDPQLTITSGPTLGALSVVEASGAGGEQTLAIGAPAFTATAVDGTSSAVSYALALAGGGATALVTTQGNHAITLVADSGTAIAGRYDSDGNGSLDATAFTLTLNGTQVTLTSLEALEHANGPQNGEDDTLDLNGLVNLVATVTVTDGDNDQVVASQATAAPLSLSFADTDPQLTITSGPTLGALSVVEASGAGGEQTLAIGAPAFTATAVDGTSSAVSYALALAGGGATALVTTQGNHAITLVADSGTAIAGRYDSDGNGSLDATAFTLTLNGTQVTLTSLEALEHANGPQNGEDDTLDLNGLVNLVATVTVTDGDNDQVVASQATAAPLSLSFADTDPQLTITAGPTLGALSVVEASGAGGEQTLAIGAPAFTATAVDGTSTAVSYALALAGGGTTALVTTQGNHAITLVADSGTAIAGRYDSDGNGSLDATAFTLTLNGTQVTLTSLEALEHANGPQNGEDDTLDLNGLVNLVATVTVTDGDNDQVVASQATAAPLSLSFADTDPQLTITAGPTLGALSVVEASGAGGEQTLAIGAPAFTATAVDGTSSAVSYALALAGGGATALVTTQGNHAITLVADSGSAIAGRYDSDGDGSFDATAFTLTLNGTQVTLTSLEALEHANGPQNGEDDTLDLNGLVNLVATVTVTDGDNDQVVASQATAAPLSLSFADTDPQLTITAGPTLGALSVVEASGAGGEQTLVIGAPAFTATAVDGTSSAVSYALALAGGGATALVTTQGNHAITLVADSGSVIAGRYDSDGDGSLDATAFTLTLNGTQVTLTSLEALEHANGPQNGEDDTLDLNGLVNLVATVTVTDGDNDQVVASQATAAPLSLSFADTDPQLTITSGPTLGALSVVEASGAGGEQTLAIGAPAFTATAVDGTSSAVSYALALAGGGATALVTTQGNHAITLVADSGSAIAGRYDSDGNGSLDATAFTLTLNGTQVTLTSLEALEHANGPQNGEDDTLDLNGLVNLVATVTVTDGDNDQVVASQATAAPLSLSFADTDPAAKPDTDIVDQAGFTQATGNVVSGAGTTSGAAGQDVTNVDGATVSAISFGATSDNSFDSNGQLVLAGQYGVLKIDATGQYTYTATATGVPSGATETFGYVLTDGDNDSSPATLVITFPTIAAPSVAVTAGDATLEDTPVATTFTATPGDAASAITTITVGGLTGWAADTVLANINVTNGTLAGATFSSGTLTLSISGATAGSPVSATVNLSPPANTDIDAALTLSATSTTGPVAATGNSTDTLYVDAVADSPTNVDITIADSADSGASFSNSEIGTLNVKSTFADVGDGSETHSLTINLQPGFAALGLAASGASWTSGATTYNYAYTYDATAGTITVNVPNATAAVDLNFTVQAPATGTLPSTLNFDVTATATEAPHDGGVGAAAIDLASNDIASVSDSTGIPATRTLNATIVTNTNQNPQLSILTFVDSSHPLDAYSRVVLLNAQGQQGTLLADAGFNIDPTHQFRVAVEENIFSSGKVQYTNLSIEGVKINPPSGNIQLDHDLNGGTNMGMTTVIQPSTMTSITGTYSSDGSSSDNTLNDAAGSFNMLFGGGGHDTLNGSSDADMLLGGTGIDKLSGAAGDDILVYSKNDAGTGVDVDGGSGFDILRIDDGALYNTSLQGGPSTNLAGANPEDILSATVDLTQSTVDITNIEAILLTEEAVSDSSLGTTLKISAQDVLDMSSSDTLYVIGSAGDKVDLSGDAATWVDTGTNVTSHGGQVFSTWTAAMPGGVTATLYVDDNVVVTGTP